MLKIFQQTNQIMNQAGIIMSKKLSVNQTLYVKLNSIEYSYKKFNIQNIKSLELGQQQIILPNLCTSIGSNNCSNIIMTSQVKYLNLLMAFNK
jgi:hypothetical protein